jgi:hypothetical protein
VNIFLPNADHMKQAAQAAQERAARRSQGSYTFYNLAEGTETYFYVLPPWSERGAIGRVVWQHFGVPEAKQYTCWQTYDIVHPGIGDQCPVCNALHAVEKVAGDALDRLWGKPRGRVNVLVVGHRKLNANGDAVEPFFPFAEENPRFPKILSLPISVYDELMLIQNGPGVGLVCMPDDAVMVIVKRSGTGIDTEYKLDFAGSRDVTGGFTPNRSKMFTSEDEATACLSKLPDLDKLWPMPDEELVATAHRVSTAIRMKFGLPDTPMFAGTSAPAPQTLYAPMAQSAPSYAPPMMPSAPPYAPVASPRPSAAYVPPMTPSAPPYAPMAQPVAQPMVQPSAPPTMAPSPVSYAQPVVAAPPPVQTSTPAPSVAPPVVVQPVVVQPVAAQPVAAPSAQTAAPGVAPPTPGVSIEKCATEPLGPKPPADPAMPNRPICFKNMNLVSAGPNKAWCEPCPFKVPCKMCSAKGK